MRLTDPLTIWLKLVAVLAAAAGGAGSASAIYSVVDGSHGARLAEAIAAGILGALFAATPWLVVATALTLLRDIAAHTNPG